MGFRVGIDVGGTFTDVVFQNEETGEIQFVKVDSTPHDQSVGILSGIESAIKKYQIEFKETSHLIHGTTVATNAVLEHTGGKTVLLTTKGFGDILEIARQVRPKLYDSWARQPEPLVPRHLVFEIPERIAYDGQILRKLDVTAMNTIIDQIGERILPDAIAISLLHSYRNPVHEQQLKNLVLSKYPDIPVFTSHEVHPVIREYERTSTVVINAYITPKISRYLHQLVKRIGELGFRKEIYVMQANGGMISMDTAETKGMYTIFSGPAAGVLGGGRVGELAGNRNVITLDMGGTSADVALIKEGVRKVVSSTEIGGHPLSISTIDVKSVGAGGGSIAWIDAGGNLRVGPQSAGADPGPACYGKGGEEPTVTDANLVIGVINPENFLGGEKRLNRSKAHRIIEEKIARPLGMGMEEVASGIIQVANANMVRAIRVISVEEGHDPREFALVAFGGAGPMHAAAVAEELGMPKVIIPFAPGILSALGCLIADVRMDYAQTYVKSLKGLDHELLARMFDEMEKKGLDSKEKEKIKPDGVSFMRSIDMRYAGQAYELPVPIPQGKITEETVQILAREFHRIHEMVYGYAIENEPIDVINLRLTVAGKLSNKSIGLSNDSRRRSEPLERLKKVRKVFFEGTWHDADVYQRGDLIPGDELRGPAIVEGTDSTVVVPPDKRAGVDDHANVVIDMR